jgi:hypothetical protein
MCRNIRPLFNFEPPATDEEIVAASVQFVRKLSGFTKPSQQNHRVFDRAVREIAKSARRLVENLSTEAPPKNREFEAEKRKARSRERFAVAPLVLPQGSSKRRSLPSKAGVKTT